MKKKKTLILCSSKTRVYRAYNVRNLGRDKNMFVFFTAWKQSERIEFYGRSIMVWMKINSNIRRKLRTIFSANPGRHVFRRRFHRSPYIQYGNCRRHKRPFVRKVRRSDVKIASKNSRWKPIASTESRERNTRRVGIFLDWTHAVRMFCRRGTLLKFWHWRWKFG